MIESLPRYSHNYYISILRMSNVTSLLKRRWKFMFGFSNKSSNKNIEDDYDKHNRRVRDLVSRKTQILDEYNKIMAEKKINAPKLTLRSSIASSMSARRSKERSSIDFQLENLKTEKIFNLSVDEIKNQLNELHDSLFKCPQINFNVNGSPEGREGSSSSLSENSMISGISGMFAASGLSTPDGKRSTSTAATSSMTIETPETPSYLQEPYSPSKEKSSKLQNFRSNLLPILLCRPKNALITFLGGQASSRSGKDCTRDLTFRNPEIPSSTYQKYIKEPEPYGNPFKLIIRPKNQSIQMNEIEDEAFNTKVIEKKKASRLASFANIYKQRVNKQIKEYIKYYRENRDMKKLNSKLLGLQNKHEEEKLLKKRREEELKEQQKRRESSGWSNVPGEEGTLLGRRAFDQIEGLQDLGKINLPFLLHKNYSFFDFFLNFLDSDFGIRSILKLDKVNPENDPYRYGACTLLFDDLFNIYDEITKKMNTEIGDEWKEMVRSKLRVLSVKYEECFERGYLNKKFSSFARTYFNMEI